MSFDQAVKRLAKSKKLKAVFVIGILPTGDIIDSSFAQEDIKIAFAGIADEMYECFVSQLDDKINAKVFTDKEVDF